MRKPFLRQTALVLAGILLIALAGCHEAPASTEQPQTGEGASALSEPSASVAEEPAETAGAQAPEASLPDPEGAAVFTYEQCEEAALRAQQYWYADMTTGAAAYRNALVDSVAASVVPYERCISNERLVTLVSFGEEGKRPADRIYAGTDLLVEVHFYVEYQPEIYYLGPQYGDGLDTVYILVPVDTAQPCEVISGWYYNQYGDNIPRPGQTLMADGLTIYQSRMVLHQCQAMAAAGLREFSSPADWTEEELYRYLYYRGQDFGLKEDTWQNKEVANSYGNLLLTIDFTQEDDWSHNDRFLERLWPGFSAENIEKYTAGLDGSAIPGYGGENTGWQFDWDGDTLVAKLKSEAGYATQEYRFQLYEGFMVWNGRAVCVGGQPLS